MTAVLPASVSASEAIGALVWLLILAAAFLLWRSIDIRIGLSVETAELWTDRLSDAWDGYTFVILADLHGNVFGENQEELLAAIRAQQPDAVLIAGDMITEREGRTPDLESLWILLEALAGQYPVYYADGNHEQRMDGTETFDEWLAQMGVVHLVDASVCVEKQPGEGTLRISGVRLPERCYEKKGEPEPLGDGFLERALGPVPEAVFQILLAHSPLYAEDYAAWGADLTVCGHFHGGTIRLPRLGGVMTPQFQFFYPYTRGLYELAAGKDGRKATLAVSAGLGTHSINLRLNNPAQLLTVRLRTKQE